MGEIEIYSAALCRNKTHLGAYAYFLIDPETDDATTPPEAHVKASCCSSNPEISLLAMLHALSGANPAAGEVITFYSNSYYLGKALTRNWPDLWRRNAYRRVFDNVPIKHQQLWKQVHPLLSKVNFIYVRDLSAAPLLYEADILASNALIEFESKQTN